MAPSRRPSSRRAAGGAGRVEDREAADVCAGSTREADGLVAAVGGPDRREDHDPAVPRDAMTTGPAEHDLLRERPEPAKARRAPAETRPERRSSERIGPAGGCRRGRRGSGPSGRRTGRRRAATRPRAPTACRCRGRRRRRGAAATADAVPASSSFSGAGSRTPAARGAPRRERPRRSSAGAASLRPAPLAPAAALALLPPRPSTAPRSSSWSPSSVRARRRAGAVP